MRRSVYFTHSSVFWWLGLTHWELYYKKLKDQMLERVLFEEKRKILITPFYKHRFNWVGFLRKPSWRKSSSVFPLHIRVAQIRKHTSSAWGTLIFLGICFTKTYDISIDFKFGRKLCSFVLQLFLSRQKWLKMHIDLPNVLEDFFFKSYIL